MLRSNIYYWDVSKQNPEPAFDPNYMLDVRISSRHMRTIKRIRHLIRRICEEEKYEDTSLLTELDKLLLEEGAQYSEFVAFMNTCDISRSIYIDLEEPIRLEVLNHIIRTFCKKRFEMYKHIADEDPCIAQAIMDRGAVRRFAELGKIKVKKLLYDYNFTEIEAPTPFCSIPSKLIFDVNRHKRAFSRICALLRLQRKFKKRPDLMVKVYDHVLIMEVKHVKEAGGAQDKQIKELIDFISISEANRTDIHYLSFLDGRYANVVFRGQHQYSSDAITALKQNPSNLFVNTMGFIQLIKDILSSYHG